MEQILLYKFIIHLNQTLEVHIKKSRGWKMKTRIVLNFTLLIYPLFMEMNAFENSMEEIVPS